MATLVVSFCNVFPPGLVLGLYDFDSDAFRWIELNENYLGVDGICSRQDGYWFLPQLKWGGISGLAMMDCDLNLRRSYKLAKTGDAHSLIAHDAGFIITDTMRNRLNFVQLVNNNGTFTESEYWRYCDEQMDVVHLNSVAQLNSDIYVSIFGPKPVEGWRFAQGGQIINISQHNSVVYENLFHPHSLANIEGALYWLESGRGLVHRFSQEDGHQIVLQLGGYLRGLTYDDRYLYVAASALRRRSRSTGVMSIPPSTNPEDLHSWIYRINRENLQVERRRLTAFGAEIYELALVVRKRSESYLQRGVDGVIQRIWRYEDACLKLEADLQAQLADKDGLGLSLQQEISRFADRVETLEAQLAEREVSVASLTQQLASVRQEISRFADRVQTLEAQLAEREVSVTSLTQQLASVYNSRRWQLATRLAEGYRKIRRLLDLIELKKDRR